MKAIIIASFFLASSAVASAEHAVVGLNIYCDPIGTVYSGGSPLFDETTGQSMTREQYLRSKSLNEYCDPIGTVYSGGSPLFDEATGRSITLEQYLASKPWVR